jgi:hypothetical protein
MGNNLDEEPENLRPLLPAPVLWAGTSAACLFIAGIFSAAPDATETLVSHTPDWLWISGGICLGVASVLILVNDLTNRD